MKAAMKHDEDDEEDCKPPAKRPRRKASLKSQAKMTEAAQEEADLVDASKQRPGRKKQAALKSEEPPEQDDDDADADYSSENESKQRGGDARNRKRGRKKNEKSNPAARPVINVDAMVNVMEFLPPRSLFNVAMTCKSLREMVTTKMVVQSALIHGGNAAKSMEELHVLMGNHSIHIPSPLRLLRLANGKRCEFCLENRVNHVRPGLGVFACWDCVSRGGKSLWGPNGNIGDRVTEKLTRVWKTSWSRYKHKPIYRTIIIHSRVASNGYATNHYFWGRHRVDMGGEKVGPLVSWSDVDALSNYYDKLKDAAAKEGKKSVVTEEKEDDDEEEEASPSLANGEWIDHYLTTNLNAPSKEDYAEFNDAYINSVRMAERVAVEREELKETKRDDMKQSKVVKVEKMLEDLKQLIDHPFREYALEVCGKESYLKRSSSSTGPCVSLVTPFINIWLYRYIKSPSKMTKKEMKEIAEKINIALRRIEKVLEMDFLSDDDVFQAGAKVIFRQTFPDVQAMFRGTLLYGDFIQNGLDDNFLLLVNADLFFGALRHLISNKLSSLLLVTEPSVSLVKSFAYFDDTDLNAIAMRAWFPISNHADDARASEAFAANHKKFGEMMAKFSKFDIWLKDEKKFEEDRRSSVLKKIVKLPFILSEFMKEADFGKFWQNQIIWLLS